MPSEWLELHPVSPCNIPPEAVVEVLSEPTAELFLGRTDALLALLRVGLLAGIEMTAPTLLHLLLDIANSIVSSDQQLIVYGQRPGESPAQIARHFDAAPPPAHEANALHAWAGHLGKPFRVSHGMHAATDELLDDVHCRHALASPLFVEHEWAGSIQLFRTGEAPFTTADARLLWMLSLLAEHQMDRICSFQNLARMAFTDYLTGLRARGYFEKTLEQEVHRAIRKSSSCGLVLIDLDDFKSVNDRFGHHAGDAVLREFANLLCQDMREVDTVARFGGDEFALILPDTDESGVRLVIERLQRAVGRHPFALPTSDLRLQLGISVGIALCPADERAPDPLLRAADLALYHAKRKGKDRPFFVRELRRAG